MYDVPPPPSWAEYFDRMIEAPAAEMHYVDIKAYLGEEFISTEVWQDHDGIYHMRGVTTSGQRCLIFLQGDSRWPKFDVTIAQQ